VVCPVGDGALNEILQPPGEVLPKGRATTIDVVTSVRLGDDLPVLIEGVLLGAKRSPTPLPLAQGRSHPVLDHPTFIATSLVDAPSPLARFPFFLPKMISFSAAPTSGPHGRRRRRGPSPKEGPGRELRCSSQASSSPPTLCGLVAPWRSLCQVAEAVVGPVSLSPALDAFPIHIIITRSSEFPLPMRVSHVSASEMIG
jgi:hypothetical protein